MNGVILDGRQRADAWRFSNVRLVSLDSLRMNGDLGAGTMLYGVELNEEVIFAEAVMARVGDSQAVDEHAWRFGAKTLRGEHEGDAAFKTGYGACDVSMLILFFCDVDVRAPVAKSKPCVGIVDGRAGVA